MFLASCTIYSLTDFEEPAQPLHEIKIIKKKYDSPPLTRSELGTLIEMAVYNGQPEYYGDMILDRQSKKHKSKPVVFSHQVHRRYFTCNVCHTELEFSLSKGQTDITREDNLDGRYCGACHNGKFAFSTEFACDACHLDINPNEHRYPPRKARGDNVPLPQTSYGDHINWVKAINEGLILPERSLPGGSVTSSMPLPGYLEEPLYWTTAVPNIIVHFPHSEHVKWLDCSNCHPDLFSVKQAGTVAFDKESNLYGKFCGTCHMTVAFPMNGCSRCHPRVKNHIGKKP